ncbi:hypothetical protein [Rhizohabitans arisaemae]|uniref:hypothetical protein n=1 Tax=Rhizohabitans arisaemae TaxID=2720610 RepID=UPI0024B258BB|nr:hypothetical protein [Rhizohabitans arisaemae]
MSLPIAFSILSFLVAVLSLLAVAAVHSRLRLLERTALAPGSDLFAAEERRVPPALRPGAGQDAALILQLDGICPTCHVLAETVASMEIPGVRAVALFANADGAAGFGGGLDSAGSPSPAVPVPRSR